MRLIIDTSQGIAGDIVVASLYFFSKREEILRYMEDVAKEIGNCKITPSVNWDSVKLNVSLEERVHHLPFPLAKEILSNSLQTIGLKNRYKEIAFQILDTLITAESYVHKQVNFRPVLHEAKDIIIDIVGCVVGLQFLGIKEVYYFDHINVGNGKVSFSHGIYDVPAPATKYILEKYNFKWKKSNVEAELATPTGVSILAGCNAKRIIAMDGFHKKSQCKALGNKTNIPVKFYLVR